jgi:DnaA regulatory inactivator Hda/CDP-diacylglycerol--glycerol-3-phosphate 3-phosphatidyltransferase
MAVATSGRPRGLPGAVARIATYALTAAWQNTANILTLARLACIPLLLLLLAEGEADAAFYVFAAAAVSDALDGFLAKRFTGVTAVGAVLDPLADKLLITALLASLALSGAIPAWLFVLTLLRDVLIVAGAALLRFTVPTFRIVPHPLGKLCTFAQLCLGGAALAGLGAFPALGAWSRRWPTSPRPSSWAPVSPISRPRGAPSQPPPGRRLAEPTRVGSGGDTTGGRAADLRGGDGGPVADHRQLALDLPHEPGSGLEDFLPAPCNATAFDAVLRWPDWPGPALVLSGPPGSGKSHLARIWARRAAAAYLAGREVWEPAEPLHRLGSAPALVVDDADTAADEVALFHLYNAVVGRGGSVLLTASSPPAAWPVALPDLRSRLLAAWSVPIAAPDETLLAALLVKQFADRQLRVEPPVVGYLAQRLERSFAAARGIVAALDRASLRARRPVTLPLARTVLLECREEGEVAA